MERKIGWNEMQQLFEAARLARAKARAARPSRRRGHRAEALRNEQNGALAALAWR
jgi:hypothetical protein